MKNIIKTSLILLIGIVGNAQINKPALPAANIAGENPFLDLSEYSVGAPLGADNNEAKGLVFPSTNLTNWVFNTAGLGAIFPTSFDGMIVYNTGTGATGLTQVTQGVQVNVAPGFYYFSNPDGALGSNSVDTGRWLPLGTVGGAAGAVKSKTVAVTVPANATTTLLDLGTGTIAANEVLTFLGAKIYNSNGDLVATADSSYAKATNILNVGNGFMSQVLAAGTYNVVVDYK